ncbi:MAG: flagellar basal body rod protein FlgC [Nitrospinae bacterium]|nr:flagellar basal body rod protein FlgC [Nitrospinota bacterium]
MDLSIPFEISASGLQAQRLRMNTISSNLANIQSTRTAQGGPYRRKEVIFTGVPLPEQTFGRALTLATSPLQAVQVTAIMEDTRDPKRIFDPGHPDADSDGVISLPNINLMEEMVNLMSATRSYEANITVIDAAKNMALKALEIGR